MFEGTEPEWGGRGAADDFFHPELVAALGEWRTVLAGLPHVGKKVYEWRRGVEDDAPAVPAGVTVADLMTRAFLTAAPEDTVGETVEKLAQHEGARRRSSWTSAG